MWCELHSASTKYTHSRDYVPDAGMYSKGRSVHEAEDVKKARRSHRKQKQKTRQEPPEVLGPVDIDRLQNARVLAEDDVRSLLRDSVWQKQVNKYTKARQHFDLQAVVMVCEVMGSGRMEASMTRRPVVPYTLVRVSPAFSSPSREDTHCSLLFTTPPLARGNMEELPTQCEAP